MSNEPIELATVDDIAALTAAIPLDSYECLNCKLWSSYPQAAEPDYCPFCGEEQLRWRTDNNWKLVEVVS